MGTARGCRELGDFHALNASVAPTLAHPVRRVTAVKHGTDADPPS
jgi:hypothetical protein